MFTFFYWLIFHNISCFSNKLNFIYYRHFKVLSDVILELMKMYTKLLKKYIKANNVNLGRRPCFWKFRLKINSPAKLKSVYNNFFLKFHVYITTGLHRFLLFIISELLWLPGNYYLSHSSVEKRLVHAFIAGIWILFPDSTFHANKHYITYTSIC